MIKLKYIVQLEKENTLLRSHVEYKPSSFNSSLTLPNYYFLFKNKLTIKEDSIKKTIFLEDIPADKFRINWFHKAICNTINPLCLASSLYVKGVSFESLVDFFNDFRKIYRLSNANDLFGLEDSVFDHSESIFKSGFPWDETDFDKVQVMREKNHRNENLVYGLNSYCYFGSENCSYQKAEVEAKRVSYLIDDINRNGYDFNKGSDHVTVNILKDGESYTALVGAGNHRVAALIAGFRYKKVSAILNKIIDRSDVKNWKHVKNGFYTKEQALQVFDAIMSGIPPKSFDKWKKYIEGKVSES